MTVVVKLGGCNGSGKTSLMRAVMNHITGGKPLKGCWFSGANKNPNFYRGHYSSAEFLILGSYESVCGGMDTISDKDERLALLRYSVKPGRIVLYEGLITGKTYGAMGALSEEHRKRGIPWLYAFMDTPFEVCTARVLERRAAKGNDAPFDPERTMRPTFKSCIATAARAKAEGHKVHMINHLQKPAVAARVLVTKAMELYHASK